MKSLNTHHLRILLFIWLACLFALCLCGLIIFLVMQTREAKENVVDLNNGFGTLNAPLPSGTVAFLGDFNVLPVYYTRPATDLVTSFHLVNRPPESGSDYVLVRFRIECNQESCKGSDFHVRLLDSQGQERGRPFGILLNENLEGMNTTQGGIMEGWQVFEVPSTLGLNYIKMWREDGATLYAQLPPARR